MADVRAMLRQERAARQQTERNQRSSAAPAAAPSSKKRKAPDYAAEERKRTRTAPNQAVPSTPSDKRNSTIEEATSTPGEVAVAEDVPPQNEVGQAALQEEEIEAPSQHAQQVDDAELDAFIKEIEEAPETQPGIYDRYSGTVVEAAPMTAAEVAAQAKIEQSAERERKEEEMEAEREEAERNLADEFEEMESLEERVRRLREQREALRKAHSSTKPAGDPLPGPALGPAPAMEEEDESEDEDFDDMDWRFRAA
ncbi:uncharacterized protein EI97DRAFT_431300 [Westerdykella ornata]|uniref:Uncharacterized protein n=1 Tax=Westerdykella ornata TaxID=318751 RepID=A0A6A6JRR5_WESOR|nr:uncharacterized protein EI97DRAFT_431300 [Westerdykella ornata]KAF2279087.1 hypothetical protein EI97DRAFT_431300 [Westerdykella ornata]